MLTFSILGDYNFEKDVYLFSDARWQVAVVGAVAKEGIVD